MMKKSFLFLMAFSAIAVFFSCSSDDDDNSGNQYDAHRGIVKANQEVDLGIVVQSNGKLYKVIFAKSNLTATGLAEKETDFGDYFAWSATEPWYTSITRYSNKVVVDWKKGMEDGYVETNVPYFSSVDTIHYPQNPWDEMVVEYTYSKYADAEKNQQNLDLSDDAAHKILGGDWQLPNSEIWEALIDNFSYEYIKEGVKGIRFSKNNLTLFLPVTGSFVGTKYYSDNEEGLYWSNTAPSFYEWGEAEANLLYFRVLRNAEENICDFNINPSLPRRNGFSIRPVRLVEI